MPDALRDLLDGRWATLRRNAVDLLAKLEPTPVDPGREEYRAWVLEQLHALAEGGHALIGFPAEQGGQDDVGGSVVAFEVLGFGDLSLMVKAGVQWGLFGGAVQALGTRRHHDEHLPGIMSLDLPGCFAMTETGHGSDVQNLRTTATYDPATREFVVHTPDEAARKDYIGNAARDGRMAVVFAQLVTGGEAHGVHALLVPIRDASGAPAPGVSIEDCGPKAGLNGVDNGRLSFDGVRVPRSALLDRYGSVSPDGVYSSPVEGDGRRFFTMLGTLVRGRISVAGGAGSATKRALAIAVRYGLARRQFTRPGGDEEVVVLDYLAHQRRLLPALATTYALHFAQEELVSALHDVADDRGRRELESRAAGLKAVATWHATATIQTCREACGGAGYLAENLLAGLKADTDVFTTFEGDNTVLLQLVAKGLLTSYRDHVGDLDPWGMARFVADQFVGAVIERTAARAVVDRLAGGSSDALLDRGWQLRQFEDRERHVVEGLARRLRRATPQNAFEVFNAAQDHLLHAARVHVDRVVLEAFVAALARCDDEPTAALLGRVCDLYALSTVEADRAWFLEHGRLTPARSKAVTQAVNELCAGIRPHARRLVDAFGIPESRLDAPIIAR
ncbi:acyl-CoA dehydrogenase family protein [Saccharothrix algeriensis]|uniref:acyl-CoA oxidase n=1 Tax=Saccharothrix algeriensis TaxID=173560 RepID=A0A8T8HZ16_9PSEU|nr:acyl-CoA dehydrogenase [Saccharothrix algeriensis]MBM7809569.1 acyl-CoA oxidase [Saccharothrix algeriensis]QTR03883.1 acyl-CoA dehydrogenase family protein [Saccharothrix algeriensis]